MELQRAGRFQEAEAIYRQILLTAPDDFDALEGQGVLALQTGRAAEAVVHLQHAIRIRPDSAATYDFLATTLHELNRIDETIAAYKMGLRLEPGNWKSWNNLGTAQAILLQMLDAERSFQQALHLKPDYFPALVNLANTIAEPGRIEEAITLCQRALAIYPDDEMMRYLFAALTGKNTPVIAPKNYLTTMFDNYASTFDEHLHHLNYSGPPTLRKLVDDIPNTHTLDILDIGCGTGLCGVAFSDLARTLIGVDLSSQMLKQARIRGIYANLIQGDFLDVLRANSVTYDMILSADLFIYVGDLSEVFSLARRSLRKGGRFLLTIEDHDGEGYLLRQSRRFAHSESYLRQVAESAGFIVENMRRSVIRKEYDDAIEGAAYVFRAADASVSSPLSGENCHQ